MYSRSVEELETAQFGVDPSSNQQIPLEGIVAHPDRSKSALALSDVVSHLKSTYSSTLGVETAHLVSKAERDWFASKMESVDRSKYLTPAEKRNIYSLLLQSETLDHFMIKKYGAFKRYGLEGGEAMIPAVDAIFRQASASGVTDVVIGMPHRGRSNFILTMLDLPARYMFMKIRGRSLIPEGMDATDDVISHIAVSTTKKFDGEHPLRVSMVHNPSHLEAVNPVSQGKTRARQNMRNIDKAAAEKEVLNFQIHGDAAFAGQGIVAESLMLSKLENYSCGGTVHMILNNQLGFTTPSHRGRSSLHPSDVAKHINAPILHVNGECMEDVIFASRLAVDYRNKFHKDVVINLVVYRKWGHNELDEPAFTQPKMYENIRSRDSITKKYAAQLHKEKLLNEKQMNKLVSRLNNYLETELEASADSPASNKWFFTEKWNGFRQPDDMTKPVDTGVDLKTLREVGIASVEVPNDFTPHNRLGRLHIPGRKKLCESGKGLDWATCEALAFGSLLKNGVNVRISGQDVERGTFSQRHAVLYDQNTQQPYTPLANLNGASGKFYPCSSPLSEEAVLGFEFGYSMESPNNLTIWEAQFGDFFNGAQTIIDAFITSAESKWMRQSAIVLSLPHGYDGAGPEHSSARPERWLQMIDNDSTSSSIDDEKRVCNMRVVCPSTPANYFHVLRRQMVTDYRRPLVIIGPKTLLRLPEAVSDMEEMAPGTHFQSVIGDRITEANPQRVKTVAFVTGKHYYELSKERTKRKQNDVAFVRIEEFAPFPMKRISEELQRYPNMENVVFCQEESMNGGFWNYVQPRLQRALDPLGLKLRYSGRSALSAPAVSCGTWHKEEVSQILSEVFEMTASTSSPATQDTKSNEAQPFASAGGDSKSPPATKPNVHSVFNPSYPAGSARPTPSPAFVAKSS